MLANRKDRLELAVVLSLFVIANVLSQMFQRPITANDGQGFDGAFYFKVAEQLADHAAPHTRGPFVFRIGTPLLVSIFFPRDLWLGFKVVNLVANTCIVLLFVAWLRSYLDDWRIRVMLTALFLGAWGGPIRFVYFYPVYSDPWYFVAVLGSLVVIARTRGRPSWAQSCLLGVVSAVGVAFREATLLIPAAFLFVRNPLSLSPEACAASPWAWIRRSIASIPVRCWLPFACGILGLLAVSRIGSQEDSYSPLRQVWHFAYTKPFLTYVHAWFIAFGPILVILMYCWRWVGRFLARNQSLLVFLAGVAIQGWLGGSDTERILFAAAPVIFLLVGKVLEDDVASTRAVLVKSLPLAVLLCSSQLISARVFWTTPDYANRSVTPFPILTPLSDDFPWLDLYSWHGNRIIQAISLLEYLALTVLLLLGLHFRAQRLRLNGAEGRDPSP